MSGATPNSLAGFAETADRDAATLLVVNRTEPAPILRLLERAFANQPVSVAECRLPGPVEDLVLLLDDEGLVATSSLESLANSYLLINADRFRTGANDLATPSVPAVIRELTDVPFDLRGYPASAKEKLLLVVMSRYVEARAYDVGSGTLRVGLQRFSRLDDEYGTRRVYEVLGESGVETHLYGVGETDAVPDGVRAHAGETEEFRHAWFLTFRAPAASEAAVALVAWEHGDNRWRGLWTFDPERTAAVGDYVAAAL